MASAVDRQTLICCWGIQDTVHVGICAGCPSVTVAVECWDSKKNEQRGMHSLGFLSHYVHKGLVYFDLNTNSVFTESDDKHGAQ